MSAFAEEFPLPSVTVEALRAAQEREERTRARDAARDAGIEASPISLAGPGMTRASALDDRGIDRRLDDLRKVVASEQNRLQPETPPLYRMTPRQRQAVHKGIDFLAEVVAQNIIRPEDDQQLRELRRREAAAHSRSSATGLQIYKSDA